MKRGTTGSTSVTVSVPMEDESDVESSLVLDAEEDAKETEVKGDASDGVDTFWVGWAVGFFFLARGRMVELEVGRFSPGAWISVPSWCFFSL